MNLNRSDIKKAILQSQHCQRNWDLTKQIPDEDIKTIVESVTQCPSKQNVAHYSVNVITDRNLIEQIHEHTRGFATKFDPYEAETNSQVLANLLLIFEEAAIDISDNINRSDETRLIASGHADEATYNLLKRDRYMSVGIASGYANIISNMMGYNTGYCACFDSENIKKILNTNNDILLMLGIGFKNENIDRKMHHVRRFIYTAKIKQEIKVNYK